MPANRSYTTALRRVSSATSATSAAMDRSSAVSGSAAALTAARADGAAQQPMSGDGGVDPQQLFADALGVRVGEGESDVVGQRAEVGDVVVEPFELDEQGPQPVYLVGQVDTERVFDGEAVGERVRDGGVAADAFGQLDCACQRCGPAKSFSSPGGRTTAGP